MKILIQLGWRNLWRNSRRSLVVISSIGFGIFAMILSIGVMNGMNNQMVENTINTSLGHIAIQRKGFQDDMKLSLNFAPSEKTVRILKGIPEIRGFAPSVKVEGIVRSSESSQGVLVVGIDPEKEKTVSEIFQYTITEEGSRFLKNGDSGSVLVSRTLAEKLDLLPGDKLVLMLQDKHREIVGVGMRIVGLFQTPVDSFDKFVIFTPIKKLQEITGLGVSISRITLRLSGSRAVDNVKESIIAALDDNSIEVLSWKDMAPNLVSAIKLFDQMMYIFFAIIFITVIFSVANTLIMAIMERFHEIGVMKSIGTRPSWIFYLIMIEATFLGAVGLLAGCAAGLGFMALLSHTGIDFSFYMESMRTWGTGSIIYPAIRPIDILMAGVIVLVTTVLAALYPALKAARIKPLEALHYM